MLLLEEDQNMLLGIPSRPSYCFPERGERPKAMMQRVLRQRCSSWLRVKRLDCSSQRVARRLASCIATTCGWCVLVTLVILPLYFAVDKVVVDYR